MNTVKISVVLLLILALTLSCLPLGAITAFAADIGEEQILPSELSDPNALETIDATEATIIVSLLSITLLIAEVLNISIS